MQDVSLSYCFDCIPQCLDRTSKQGDTRHGSRVGAGCESMTKYIPETIRKSYIRNVRKDTYSHEKFCN